jgi:hypothetical protein
MLPQRVGVVNRRDAGSHARNAILRPAAPIRAHSASARLPAMTDGPAHRPEHSDSMSEESARLEALLQAAPIFAALERVELARLVGALEETHLAAREVIFKEGGESNGLYIVQSGQVHLTVHAPDGERLIRVVGAGMHFGEVGMLVAANAWIHPSLSDYCRVTSDAAGEDLFWSAPGRARRHRAHRAHGDRPRRLDTVLAHARNPRALTRAAGGRGESVRRNSWRRRDMHSERTQWLNSASERSLT